MCIRIVWNACMCEGEAFVPKTCGVSENYLRVSLRYAGYWGSKESSIWFFPCIPTSSLPKSGNSKMESDASFIYAKWR